MLRSLRSRLVLSHLLPLLVLVPLFSLLLVYLLETRYALNTVATELAVQGELIARLTQYEWQAYKDPEQARPLMARLQVQVPARIYLVDRNGRLLVTSGVATASTQVPVRPPDPDLVQKALAGELARQFRYSLNSDENAVDVAVPVMNEDQEVVGAVQLSQQLDQVGDRLTLLRWTVWGTVAAGLLAAGLLSIALSRSVNRPLEQLTAATRAVRFDAPFSPVPEKGPTEVRTLARTFNEMADRLYEAEQGRRRLLRAVVHELGRPLGAIKAAAQVLYRDGTDPTLVTELSSGIDEQVDQLRRLLDDLALLAQREAQELRLARQTVDLVALIREECRRNGPKMRSKEIELHFHSGDLPPVQADPMRMAQIIGNLLDNAYKYTPHGGRVTVQAQVEDGAVCVRVSDPGPGVDPEEREKIFRFLYRSPEQGRVREGMGIGLALSRRLAEAHGGTLTVEDAPGGGATFVLCLPHRTQPNREMM